MAAAISAALAAAISTALTTAISAAFIARPTAFSPVVVATTTAIAVAMPTTTATATIATSATTSTPVRGCVRIVFRACTQLRRQRLLPDFHADQLLDFREVAHFTGRDQRNAHARTFRAGGPSDTVHVILFIWRDIIIDDHLDVVDVNASTYHVRGHQDVNLPVSKPSHDILSVLLFQVRTDGAHIEPRFGQRARNDGDGAFPARENNHRLESSSFEQAHQEVGLLVVVYGIGRLDHLLCRTRQCDLNRNGVLEHGVGQLSNALWHRCAEQQGLSFRVAVFGNSVDVAEESHVQHAVGFVQNEDLEFA